MIEPKKTECSEAALDYVFQILREAPRQLRSPEDVRRCIEAFNEGANMTLDELLTRIGLKKPN